MQLITDNFNNREFAYMIWGTILFLWLLSQEKISLSIIKALYALFAKKILILIITMLIYISLLIYMFYTIGLWEVTFVKDTIYWTFGVGFILLMNTNDAHKQDTYFKKLLIDNMKLIIIIEYILNLYVFGFFVELIMTPIIIIAVMISTFAEIKSNHERVKKVMDYILSFVVIILVYFTARYMYVEYKSILSMDSLHSFIVPPLLTIGYIPFLYVIALLTLYEILFVRVNHIMKHNYKLARLTKSKIIINCHFNLNKLKLYSRELLLYEIRSRKELENEIKRIRLL